MEKNVIVVASVLGIQSPSGLQLIHGNRTVTDLKHVAKIKEAMKRGEKATHTYSHTWNLSSRIRCYLQYDITPTQRSGQPQTT